MKKILFALFICAISSTTFAQTRESKDKEEAEEGKVTAPAAVQKSFTSDYPDIKKVSWDAEAGDFEAEFKIDGTEVSALYDQSGHRKEVEMQINKKDIPAAATEYINKNLTAYKFDEAAKITSDKNVVTFEAEMKKGGKNYDALFDAKGNFISLNEGD